MPGESWRSSMAPRLLVYALIVISYLFFCRCVIVYHTLLPADPDALQILFGAIRRFGMDALAVLCITLAALITTRVSTAVATALFVMCAAYLMLFSAINIRVMSIYDQPATINLFRYGDFLDIGGVKSLAKYITSTDKVTISIAIVCVASFAFLRNVQCWFLFTWSPARRLILASSLFALIAMPSYGLLANRDGKRGQHANAGWWLLKSAIAPPSGKIREISHPDLRDPFEAYVSKEENWITTPDRIRQGGIRNVVMIVLESVGSEYLDLQRNPGLAPNMSRLLSGAAYFPNTYAPMPSSPVALFTLMTGMYPPVSPKAIPMTEPGFPATTLIETLGQSGKRTSVFSANWGFMDFAGYLEGRDVDHVEELIDEENCVVPEALNKQSSRAEPLPGEADECTFASMRKWIERTNQDFFALLWTNGTHYPYGTDPANIAADPGLARENYLAGITRTDRLVGELLASLDKQGRLDDTLVVLVGDHGESFSQHGNRVHGNDVYLEALRVPFVMFNQRLFSGVIDPTPVRLVDVAPTVLSLAGKVVPSTMQGLDLSTPQRPRRVFFSAAWLNLVMGFQEGQMKYNYAFVTDHLEVFDLARDPGERFDRSQGLGSAERASIVRRIMNWKSVVQSKLAAARSSRPDVTSSAPAAAGSSRWRRCCRRS